MSLVSARRIITACVLPAAAAAMFVAPGAASAAQQCSGENIKGAGASTQKLLHELWKVQFNTSGNKKACSGTQGSKGKPALTEYQPEGSGFGLEKYGVNGHAFEAGTFSYVGTDEAPNKKQKEEIEGNETVKGSAPESVQSIPVAQVAITIIMHLPTGCTATSTAPGAAGRLVLNNTTLESIFKGGIKKWSEIKESGDKLEGGSCNAETPFKVFVRKDESGTTHIIKKYLGLIDGGVLAAEGGLNATWPELSEGKPNNTSWPTATAVERPTANGGGALASAVAGAPSSIGYVALADARKNGGFSKTGVGGPGTEKFWAEVQHSGLSSTKPTYADPSTNGDAEALANANCLKEKYTNGKGTRFPPASTAALWNEVTTETKESKYTICGLTFGLGLSAFSAYPGTTSGVATTEENYLVWALEPKAGGGQQLIKNHDFEPVPSSLVKEATAGAKLVKF
jgi:ABC-type phosphate transport system substrate-binding protein